MSLLECQLQLAEFEWLEARTLLQSTHSRALAARGASDDVQAYVNRLRQEVAPQPLAKPTRRKLCGLFAAVGLAPRG